MRSQLRLASTSNKLPKAVRLFCFRYRSEIFYNRNPDLTEYHLPSAGPYNAKFGNRANSNGSGITPINPSSHSAYESRRAFATLCRSPPLPGYPLLPAHWVLTAIPSLSRVGVRLVAFLPQLTAFFFQTQRPAASFHNPQPSSPRHGQISVFPEERNNRLFLCFLRSSFPSTSTVVVGRRVPKLTPRPIVIKFVRSTRSLRR